MAGVQRVAFITGAARGQGRAHAVRLAADGVDVVAVDICADIDTIPYALGTRAELEETCRLVRDEGRRASAQVADVRDFGQLRQALSAGTADLGADCADIVIANAGGCAYPSDVDEVRAFRDAIDVMLTGVWNTVKATTPMLIDTGRPGVLGLMRVFANLLGPHNIRVNAIVPTGVDSAMTRNAAFANWIGGFAEKSVGNLRNVLPGVDVIAPADVAEAVAFLVSERGRYITGVCLPVDAGFCNA